MIPKYLRRLDPVLLITLALCAFSLWPLLYRAGLPNGDDVLYHVFRAAEMDRTWAHGVLLPRWAETFYTGYGAPVFHYYASLTYYLTSILARLGLNAVDGLRALIALGMLAGAAGMYGFTRAYAGKASGVIAALCYTYSPYILYTEPYSRGAYPELMAFAFFPLLMWSFSRLIRRGGALSFVLAAVGLGLLIITHNLMALALTGLLTAWVLSYQLSVFSRQSSVVSQMIQLGKIRLHRNALLAIVAIGIGVGLAAYFWLPVVAEGHAAHLNNLTGLAGVSELDYRRFFVPLNHLLEGNPRSDAGALNGLEHQLNLGLAQWLLAVTGFVGAVISYRFLAISRQPSAVSPNSVPTTQYSVLSYLIPHTSYLGTSIFFALAGLVCIFLMIPAAGSIWSIISPLAFLQFPWRLLGPAAFCLAVLAGMNAVWIERLPKHIKGAIYAALVVGIIGLASPLFYVPEWTHTTVDTSVAAYHQAELQGLQRATTFSNEYLPSDVEVEPGATPRLVADYADGYPVNKAHLETLPPGVTVEPIYHDPQQDTWRINAPEAFTFEVLTYNFAGWTAEVDGQIVPISSSIPHGLITLPVPAGEHTVHVYLGSTPPRDLGNAITYAAIIALVGVVVFLRRNKQSLVIEGTQQATLATGNWQLATNRYFLLGGIITFAFLVFYLKPGGAWEDSPPGKAELAQYPVIFQLGDQIQLIGYDLNGDTFRPGQRVELRLYWTTTGNIPYGYASFVHISTGGPPSAQADKLNPAGLPTKTWLTGGYIHDDYVIELPADMQPGHYQVIIGLYTCDTLPAGECGNGDRLRVMDAAGIDIGDAVPLTRIIVEN